jgi:hypothetical protein
VHDHETGPAAVARDQLSDCGDACTRIRAFEHANVNVGEAEEAKVNFLANR